MSIRHLLGGLCLSPLLAAPALVATYPAGFLQEPVVTTLATPTAFAFAPDGRIFVCEKGPGNASGSTNVRVVKNGVLLATPFTTFTVDSQGERGLLGVAFDPQYATNRYVYFSYTSPTPAPHNRVARVTASIANPDVTDGAAAVTILDMDNLSGATNHNGGSIHFGPDSKLYVVHGENANSANAQTLNNLLGKILRINSDGTVPIDNPYYNQPPKRGEIWANGLRNPFTFAFHPTSGRLHINDVGEVTWEEINLGARGVNYGWPTCEGACSPSNPAFTDPTFFYAHGAGAATIGGAFYTASAFPSVPYAEAYFYGDEVKSIISYLVPPAYTTSQPFGTNAGGTQAVSSPVNILLGPDGNLYYTAIGAGELRRIRYTGGANRPPSAIATATPMAGPMPLIVAFSGSQSGDPDGDPLTYSWDFGDGTMGAGVAPSHTYMAPTLPGPKTVTLTVSDGRMPPLMNATMITVVPGDNPPVPSIVTPAATFYNAGDTISYSGSATDLDETLTAAAYSWTIVFHHNTHTHPFLGPINGVTSGMFVIPNMGETATDVFYRIHLTVTDAQGVSVETTRDVVPNLATLTATTTPAGLQVTVGGQPFTAPYSFQSVVGMQRDIGTIDPQTSGICRQFLSWSDAGALTHTITTPAAMTTYTATFVADQTGPAVTPPAVATVTQTLCQ